MFDQVSLNSTELRGEKAVDNNCNTKNIAKVCLFVCREFLTDENVIKCEELMLRLRRMRTSRQRRWKWSLQRRWPSYKLKFPTHGSFVECPFFESFIEINFFWRISMTWNQGVNEETEKKAVDKEGDAVMVVWKVKPSPLNYWPSWWWWWCWWWFQ